MTLSTQDLVDARRHLGYGLFGAIGNNSLMYYRYYPHASMVEYRLQNLAPEEEIVVQNYLAIMNQLELQPAISGNGGDEDDLDTARAAVWYRNPNEISDRIDLYNYYRKIFAGLMQVPIGPFSGMTSGPTARMSV